MTRLETLGSLPQVQRVRKARDNVDGLEAKGFDIVQRNPQKAPGALPTESRAVRDPLPPVDWLEI